MNIKNTILIFTFVLIGLSSASFANAISCPTDNGAGVVCSGGTPYYCGASCRSATTMAGFCPTNAFTASAPCTALDACGACSTCATNYLLCTGPAYPTRSCTYNDPNNHCASLTGGNCNAGVCATCVGGYGLCNADSTCRVANCQPYETWNTTSCSCVGSVPTLKLGYDSVISSNFGTAVKQSALSVLSVFYGGYVSINNPTSTSALSVSNGNIFINDSLITSTTTNAAITKGYLDSALSALAADNLWKISGSNVWASTTTWNIGIGTDAPATILDVSGKFKFTSGGILYNADSSRWFDMNGTLTDSLKASGDFYSTAGELKTDGTGINYMLGSLGVGTANPTWKFQVRTTTDENFSIAGHQNFASGMTLRSVNDANSALVPLEMRASIFDFEGGNVGIGTTVPGAKLHILGDDEALADSTSGIAFAGTGTSKVQIGYSTVTTPGYGWISATKNSSTWSNLALMPNGQGNVGIATTSPDAKLQVNGSFHVSGSLNSVVFDKLTGTGGRIVMADATGSLYATSSSVATGLPVGTAGQTLRSDGTNWLANSVIYNDGTNIGIGTTSPATKFDVLGNIRANGIVQSLQVGGSGYMFSMDAANAGGPRLQLGTLASPASYFEIGAWAGINNFDSKTRDLKLFTTNGLLYITNTTGYVGVGTTTPSASLDIFGKAKITSAGTIYNTNSTRYLDMTGVLTDSLKASGDFYSTAGEIKTDGTGINYMLGSLGIGTATPTGAKLDVNGLIKMRVTSGFISSDEDVINKGYLDSAIQAATSSISGTGKFVGMTFFKYDGNNTQEGGANAGMGYAVANTLCDMNAQGSHVCSSAEMLNSIASGVTMPVENAWIFNGPPGFTTSANDCDARTLNTTSVSFPNFGTYWEGTDLGYSSGRGLLRTCDKYMKYACCK